ncbi:hypothetical protein AOQ84DRAFT_211642 [Glonium stellatum]|uniref:Copper homeostasis protein cutC homolog n=1 Tax=Glonium stellatum TaxID=574774 RepID=A0A8E2F5R2_9PEZI|nr:hypothetical protein AOQ84DRAFT_211642 [Glonium stellatum]
MLEIACFNSASALTAQRAGADRIELCTDYQAGGITPDFDALNIIRKQIDLPIYVMIRPRGGDFVYSDDEFDKMKADIIASRYVANGFVFGILNSENCIDIPRNQQLVALAAPLPCTFHRAFDQVTDFYRAAQEIANCGFTSILTSGGQANAVAGCETVAKLNQQLRDKITFILGGGIRASNIKLLMENSGIEWYHSAAITEQEISANEREIQKLQEMLHTITKPAEEIDPPD